MTTGRHRIVMRMGRAGRDRKFLAALNRGERVPASARVRGYIGWSIPEAKKAFQHWRPFA